MRFANCPASLSQVIGQLILDGRSQTDEEDEEELQQPEDGEAAASGQMDGKVRDNLLEVLAERVRDTHALTRAKVLQTLIMLVKQRAIPLSFIRTVTEVGVSRLKDKSSQVRKYAVQLVGLLLEHNPFAGVLKLSQWEAQLQAVAEELQAIENAGLEAAKLTMIKEGGQAQEQDEEQDDKEQGEEEEKEEQDEEEEKEEQDEEPAAEEAAAEPTAVVATDAEKEALLKKAKYLQSAVAFLTAMHDGTAVVVDLLDSKVADGIAVASLVGHSRFTCPFTA